VNWALGLLMRVLVALLPAITPVLREALREAVGDLERKARETESPVDDIFVQILKEILSL